MDRLTLEVHNLTERKKKKKKRRFRKPNACGADARNGAEKCLHHRLEQVDLRDGNQQLELVTRRHRVASMRRRTRSQSHEHHDTVCIEGVQRVVHEPVGRTLRD